MATKFPYKHGNFTDRVKNSNLGVMVEQIAKPFQPFSYIELHSGEGIYYDDFGGAYFGTAYQAFSKAHKIGADAMFLLHEKDDERRKKLKKNIGAYGNVRVYSGWKDNLQFCFENFASANTLIVSDPCFMSEHAEVMKILPDLLKSDVSLFMYVPEELADLQHARAVELTRELLKEYLHHEKRAIDLMHPSESGMRTEHNFIAADYDVLKKVERNHKAFVYSDACFVKKVSEIDAEEFSRGFDLAHRIV